MSCLGARLTLQRCFRHPGASRWARFFLTVSPPPTTLNISFQLFVSFLFVLSYRLRFQLSLRPPDSPELVNCSPSPLRSYTLVISGDHPPLCPARWSPHLQVQSVPHLQSSGLCPCVCSGQLRCCATTSPFGVSHAVQIPFEALP